jgi:hypothetical protein
VMPCLSTIGITAVLRAALLLSSAAGATEPGVTYRRWHSVSSTVMDDVLAAGADIDQLLSTPENTQVLHDLFEAPSNVCEACATDLRGYFRAPMSGSYTFSVASDDDGALYFGVSEAQAHRIASVPGWTEPRQWDKYSEQTSAPQSLVRGEFYFVRSVSVERFWSDNAAVGVRLPDGTDLKPLPVPGYLFVLPRPTVRVSVVELGAVDDGSTDNSAAFLEATRLARWGGEIVVPPGHFRTAAFNISSHTRLVVDGDIIGVPSRTQLDRALIGWDPTSENISIVGSGSIRNRGNAWSTSRVGFVCPHFVSHSVPGDTVTLDPDVEHECEASAKQRAALFSTFDVLMPPATERAWHPTRGEWRSAGAMYSEPQWGVP